MPQGSSLFAGLHGEWSHEGGGRHGRIPQGKNWKRRESGADNYLLSSVILSRVSEGGRV